MGMIRATMRFQVDVYRVWTDPSQQVTFYYTPVPCDGPCTESTQTGLYDYKR